MANNDKAGRKPRRQFGEIELRPSGSYRARYVGPDGDKHPRTFSGRTLAEGWLAEEHRLIERDEWTPPKFRATTVHLTVNEYAATELEARDLSPSYRNECERYLERFVTEDPLGQMPMRSVSPADVKAWLAAVRGATGKVMAARVYAFVSSVFKAAVVDDVIPSSPFRVKSASQAKQQRPQTSATAAEVAAVLEHLPETYRAMVLVAAWGGLRSGEVRNLRRQDVDLKAGTVRVRQQVQNVKGKGKVVRDVKTKAARRTVHVPKHVGEVLREQMKRVPFGRDVLVFPSTVGTPISQAVLWRTWNRARVAIGRPDLRFHDLRHTAAMLAADTGATVAELMARLGHNTPNAAMAYQHAAAGSDRRIAAALDAVAASAATAPLAVVG